MARLQAGRGLGDGDEFFKEWNRQDAARSACEESALNAKRNATPGEKTTRMKLATEDVKAWSRILGLPKKLTRQMTFESQLTSMKDALIGLLIYLTLAFGFLYVEQHIRNGNWFGTSPTFGRYRCTKDCSGHIAGYKWADAHKISSMRGCPHGNSRSFYKRVPRLKFHEAINPPDDEGDQN